MSDSPKLPDKAHEAFAHKAIQGYNIEMWVMDMKLINWDALFAFGFTSYQAYQNYLKTNYRQPVDMVRDILLRLYMVEPEFPRLLSAPPVDDLLVFLFNLDPIPIDPSDPTKKLVPAEYTRLMGLLAPILGRNRGSGYRWMRTNNGTENPVALEINRLSSKVFSMNPKYARKVFWRAALAACRGRELMTEDILEALKRHGVTL